MTQTNFRLDGKVIIITGGVGLLGREYTRAVCEAGGIPVVADLNGTQAEAVAHEMGAEAFGIGVDVSDKESVQAMKRRILDRYGRIDGLVNNAAINPKFDAGEKHLDTFEDFPLEAWNQSLAVNVTGMFLCAQAVAPTMLEQGRGVIINIASTYGITGPDQRLYIPD
ncbi:MAG: SDR family NAD(P)-dependent oxidoreductase, partial [Chloroflexota bacterium]